MAATINKLLQLSLIASVTGLITACSSPQPVISAPPVVVPSMAKPQSYTTPTGVTITPYDIEPIIRQSL